MLRYGRVGYGYAPFFPWASLELCSDGDGPFYVFEHSSVPSELALPTLS